MYGSSSTISSEHFSMATPGLLPWFPLSDRGDTDSAA
jgi:hypothetical protein